MRTVRLGRDLQFRQCVRLWFRGHADAHEGSYRPFFGWLTLNLLQRIQKMTRKSMVEDTAPLRWGDLLPLARDRKGELIALKWGDLQFGADERDPNRYILVQQNYVYGKFTSPKNKKPRRVDMSRHLRSVLVELRDERLLLIAPDLCQKLEAKTGHDVDSK